MQDNSLLKLFDSASLFIAKERLLSQPVKKCSLMEMAMVRGEGKYVCIVTGRQGAEANGAGPAAEKAESHVWHKEPQQADQACWWECAGG